LYGGLSIQRTPTASQGHAGRASDIYGGRLFISFLVRVSACVRASQPIAGSQSAFDAAARPG
jgi:hypothetical protein